MEQKKPFKTWGKSRSNRLPHYDYSSDRPAHVILCAGEKRKLFTDPRAVEALINILKESVEEGTYSLLCYCIMPNHLHILLSPEQSKTELSRLIGLFKGRSAAFFRQRFSVSQLWQTSYYDHVVRREENLRKVIQYIMGNPVRKGIVVDTENYPYAQWYENEVAKYL